MSGQTYKCDQCYQEEYWTKAHHESAGHSNFWECDECGYTFCDVCYGNHSEDEYKNLWRQAKEGY